MTDVQSNEIAVIETTMEETTLVPVIVFKRMRYQEL
jgi:hypothetical protein